VEASGLFFYNFITVDISSVTATTLWAETFAGINVRVFRVFWPFSQVYAFGNFKSEKHEGFLREIIDIFQNAKVFSSKKIIKQG